MGLKLYVGQGKENSIHMMTTVPEWPDNHILSVNNMFAALTHMIPSNEEQQALYALGHIRHIDTPRGGSYPKL